MTISRKLPRTNEQRVRAITTAKEKKDHVLPADMAITSATESRLNSIDSNYNGAMLARAVALSGQSGQLDLFNPSRDGARLFINHFIQVFNLGVTRGVYPKADRGFYQLPLNTDTLPSLDTDANLLLWGERIKTGNAARITAGGAAMSNPTAAEVDTQFQDFKTKFNATNNKKEIYDQSQEAVDGLNGEADKVIKKVWDEVEAFYNEEPDSSKRRKARAWGVVYESDVELTFHFITKESAGHTALSATGIRLIETGNLAVAGDDGKVDMNSTITDEATFEFSHPDFVTARIVVPLPSDTTEFTVIAELVHV